MALPDTTFNDLSQDEQKLAWAVYNKVTESSLDFDEQTLASSVDRVLMVNAAGTAAGTASLADLTTGLDGKYQSNLANVGSYIGVDITKKRNLWDEEWENGTWTSSTGGSGTNFTPIRCVNFIPVKPSASYYITCSSTSAIIYRRYYDANFTYLGESTTQETTGNRSFVIPSNARYMKFYVDPSYGSSYKNDIAIIEGSSGSYVPYVPTLREGTIVAYGGSDATGYYVRFADGTQIVHRRIADVERICNVPWGSVFETSAINLGNFVVPFKHNPAISISDTMPQGHWHEVRAVTMTGAGNVYIVTGQAVSSSLTFDIAYTAIGRWK